MLSAAWLPFTIASSFPSSQLDAVPDEAPVADQTALNLDSLQLVETARLVEEASEGYKNLKFIQYDGVTEAELYPTVMDTYSKVCAAMKAPRLSNEDRTRFKGILLDISDLLKRGSIYYSNQGLTADMSRFAQAYVDMRLNPEMADINFGPKTDLYPALVYCAASSAYNGGEFGKAVDYLEEYLTTGDPDRAEQVSLFLGQAAINAKCPQRAVNRMIMASERYPANFNILMLALQNCIEAGQTDRIQPLLTKALAMKPDDEQLILAQAKLFENEGNYSSAIDLFQKLYELKPNSLQVNQHLALCYYNLGADYYNKALMESEDKTAKRYSRQAQAYFSSAVGKLETIVENDPTNTKYLRALAITYGCLGNKTRLDEVNVRLQALGQKPMPMNGMPESIAFSEQTSNFASSAASVPDFQEFARGFVEKELAQWSKRGEFEKTEDYEKRVNQENVYQKYQALCKKAEADYLQKYAGRLRISDLSLEPYDVDNESYKINSAMGPIIVNVPLKNKEAEAFKASWNSIQLRNPKYFIKDNRVAIASVELVTSGGKSYRYDSSQAADYDFTDVSLDMNSFIAQGNSKRDRTDKGLSASSRPKVIRAKSDVDENIPLTNRKAEKTVALIMANENYKQVTDVESALNDGETMARYCTMTLGIPANQVLSYENMTYAEMLGAVRKLKQLVGALGDGVDVVVYYAGHGFPDEGNKDAYLLPVDGDGFTTATSYPLKKLYQDLSATGADNVMVFLDACFSGATRDGGMLAEARGVALKPRIADPEGSMFVLSAASDQETALPYKEKNHGLFTYFLLKKLQDSKGNVSLKDLSKYVEENVKKNSVTVNGKLQNPRTSVSGRMRDSWESKRLRP